MEVTCPTCRTRATWEDNPWRPFCSERCRLLDLGKWLNEEYAVPAEDDDPLSEPPEEK
jgi:endogenous inhibitor of DNA gyrase (YacG/DUF329 family)